MIIVKIVYAIQILQSMTNSFGPVMPLIKCFGNNDERKDCLRHSDSSVNDE